MKKILVLFLVLVLTPEIFSQKSTIYGNIKDASSGEPIYYATCYELNSKQYCISGENGSFSFSVPNGKIKLLVSNVGYYADTLEFILKKDTLITINLKNKVLDEIVVYAEQPIQKQALLGVTTISAKRINSIPTQFGEKDLLKALTFLPGVTGDNKGFSNIYVRGGDRQSNLMLVDGATLYSTSHLFGFLSVFNTDIVESVDFYKGGFPARFGGRTSSVIDIKTRNGDSQKIKGEFSLGLLSSKLLLEGPIIKEKTTYILAARSSYLDLITFPIRQTIKKREYGNFPSYTFFDINAKINHKINNKNRVFFNFYIGADLISIIYYENQSYKETTNISQKYITSTLGYNSIITPKLNFYTSLIYSKFNSSYYADRNKYYSEDGIVFLESSFSKIHDLSYNLRFDYKPINSQNIKFGIKTNYYQIHPGIYNYFNKNDINQTDTTFGVSEPLIAGELCGFIEDDISITKNINVNLGLRYTFFSQIADSIDFKKSAYQTFEPRFSFRWLITDKFSFKCGATVMHQFLHVLQNNVNGFGNEIWISSSKTIEPQKSSQLSGGFFGEISKHKIEYGIEIYYKKMENLINYNYIESDPTTISHWEELIAKNGLGESYGAEFLVQKNYGKFNFSLAYTLSWSWRQFEELNFGERFPFTFDKRHDLSLALNYKRSEKHSFGGMFIFSSGTPITLSEAYVQRNQYFYGYYTYTGINNRRLPPYHRLDVYYQRNWLSKRNREWNWTINIYNLYARQNAVYIYFEQNKTKQISMFTIMPTFSIGFKF